MSSTENVVTDKANKDGWLSILISGDKLIHSRHIHHRGIHSVQHIQGVHILHTGRHQHQPWAQPHAFRKCYIQDQDHVHNIHCIQDHVHSILYTSTHQHQPWAQPLAFHNRYIPIHGTQSSQGVQVHTHHIYHREGRGQ